MDMWICSDQWEEKRGLFGFFFIMFSYFSRRDPGRRGGGIHFLCSSSWHACKWHLNNCSHLAKKKNTSVRVNQSPRITETERWKEPVSLMIHTTVPLNRPILLPALLLTWDNTLPLLLRSIWVGAFCFVQKVSKQDISIWQYHSFLCLWNGPA